MSGTALQFARRAWRSSVLFAAVAALLRVGVHVVLLPAVLLYLTRSEQAIWWMFVALGNFVVLADFGFGQAITRIYNILWAGADDFEAEGLRPPSVQREPNLEGLSRLNETGRRLYGYLAIGAMLVLATAGTVYLYHVVPEAGVSGNVLLLWGCYLLTVGFNFSSLYWWVACTGINRVREMQVLQVWSSIIFLVVVLAGLKLGAGLAAMILGTLARAFVLRQVARSVFYKSVPKAENGRVEAALLARIWPNARKFGLLSITGYWAANGLVLMSGWFLPVETTASVGATNTVGNMLAGFAGMWLAVKWPEITVFRAQGRLQEMSVLFARRLALSVATFFAASLMVVIVGNWLLELKQASTQLLPSSILLVYLVYVFQQFIYVQFANLVFTENVVPFCGVSLITCAAMIALSVLLVPRLGLWGLVLSPLIAESVFSAWVVVRRGFSSQSITLPQFFRLAILGR